MTATAWRQWGFAFVLGLACNGAGGGCGGGQATGARPHAESMGGGGVMARDYSAGDGAQDTGPVSTTAPANAGSYVPRPRIGAPPGGPVDLSRHPGLVRIVRAGPTSSIEFYYDAADRRFELLMAIDPPPAATKPSAGAETKADATDASAVDAVLGSIRDGRGGGRSQGKRDPKQEQEAAARATKHVVYAQTHFFEQRYGRAIDELKAALQYNPDSAVALALMGSVYFKQGSRRAAIKAWEAALELDPTLDDVRRNLEQLGWRPADGNGQGDGQGDGNNE